MVFFYLILSFQALYIVGLLLKINQRLSVLLSGFLTLLSWSLFVGFIFLFIHSDTRYAIVAHTLSRGMDSSERLFASWSNATGSLFLWFTILVSFQFIQSLWAQIRKSQLLFSSFVLMIAFGLYFQNPFEYSTLGYEMGLGIPPSLRSFYIGIHPPLSFFGYSIAFFLYSYSIFGREVSYSQFKNLKIMNAFMVFLFASAIVSGAFWSYEVLWGGHWTWDPVEILTLFIFMCSILPFHFASYSWQTQLKSMQFTFPAILLSTAIIRSGILRDPHSYATSSQMWIFLTLFLFSIIPIIFLDMPKTYHIDLSFKDRGASVWLMANFLIIIILSTGIFSLTVYGFVIGKKLSPNKGFYHFIVLTLLLFPLSLTLFRDLKDTLALSFSQNSLVLFSVLVIFVGIPLMVSPPKLGYYYFIFLVFLGFLFHGRNVPPIPKKITFRKTMRIMPHLFLLFLILGMLASHYSTKVTDVDGKVGDVIQFNDDKISIVDVKYVSDPENVLPLDQPLSVNWRLDVILSINGEEKLIYAGWNDVHQFYSIPVQYRTFFSTTQVLLIFSGLSVFNSSSLNPDDFIIFFQIRETVDGYLYKTLEMFYPFTLLLPVIHYARKNGVNDFYE